MSDPTPALLSRFRFCETGTFLGLILIDTAFVWQSDTFLTAQNLINTLQQSSINASIALGMTLVIISGGMDLSVGPVAALSAVLGAAMLVAGVPVPLMPLGALAIGTFCGFFSGALIPGTTCSPSSSPLGTCPPTARWR